MYRRIRTLPYRTLIALCLVIATGSALATAPGGAAPTGEPIACPEPLAGAGDATTYIGVVNQCTLENDDGMAVAINDPQWDGSAHCGECLEVTGPGGTALLRVVDRCLECPPGGLDLQPPAWLAVTGSEEPGIVAVTWQRVPCPVTGNIALRLQGSNNFFIKLQVRNHRHGIAGVTLLHPDGAIALPRTNDNHFQSTVVPPIASPFEVVVTATTGESRTESVELLNDVDMPGSGQFAHCTLEVFRDGFETL